MTCMHDRYVAGCKSCEHDREYDTQLAHANAALIASTGDAVHAAGQALKHLGDLTGWLHDIEYAEGTEGDDCRAELEQAARSLRNVQRIAGERERKATLVPGPEAQPSREELIHQAVQTALAAAYPAGLTPDELDQRVPGFSRAAILAGLDRMQDAGLLREPVPSTVGPRYYLAPG